jgi:hypothetical protein
MDKHGKQDHAASPATIARPEQVRTRKQAAASLLAEGIATKARWKALVAPARTAWPKLSVDELKTVHGDVHRLAGLVQLRCQLSREESDRQVKAFFAQHAATA